MRSDAKVSNGKATVSENQPTDISIQVKPTEYVVGFKYVGKKKLPCARIGNIRGARVNIPVSWDKKGNYKNQRIFAINLTSFRAKTWKTLKTRYIVADTMKDAMAKTEKRFSRIVKRFSGLGRDAFTRAMGMVGDKFQSIGGTHSNTLMRNVEVEKDLNGNFTGDSGTFHITVFDNLNFATLGQKSGEQSLNMAIMKATNSINGMLNNYIKKTSQGDFFG